MKVCVAGDSGLLGQAVTGFAVQNGFEVHGASTSAFGGGLFWGSEQKKRFHHQVIDLLKDGGLFFRQAESFKPDLLVNCIALVDLALCEKKPELAAKVNSALAEAMAAFCKSVRIPFVHFSTDQVFDGLKTGGYCEEDKPAPMHVYGSTKRSGEERVMKANPDSLIIRTNIVGFRDRRERPTFAEWLCRALTAKEGIVLAEDFVTSSIHVDKLAPLIFLGVKRKLKGLFHFASSAGVSKYTFGRHLSDALAVDFSQVKKGLLKDLDLFPPRPANSALDVRKAEKALHISFPSADETIGQLAQDFKLRSRKVIHA